MTAGFGVGHAVFARLCPRMSRAMDEGGLLEHRRRLLAGLSGEVVEIGAGHGGNFLHYPRTVTRVLAVEPEPRACARSLGRPRRTPRSR